MKHIFQPNERLCTPLFSAIAATLSILFCVVINAPAQSLPTVGTKLWEIRYATTSASGAIDYAPLADLVFAGTQSDSGDIYVVQGATGKVLDTIRMGGQIIDGQPSRFACDLSCTLDGTLLCISAASIRGTGGARVVLMEYPSKRIVMDSLYYGGNENSYLISVLLSPSGRYVVVPALGNDLHRVRLYDRMRDTSIFLSSYHYDRGDFDTDERYYTFSTIGKARGEQVDNQVALLQLDDLSKPAKLYDEYGDPEISADGRFLMNTGIGVKREWPSSYYPSRVSVIDISTDSVLYKLDGEITQGSEGQPVFDLSFCFWAEDASQFFTSRRSTKSPAGWRRGVFYNVGDSLPKSTMKDSSLFSGSRIVDYRCSVANPHLTIGFTNSGTVLRAELLTPTTSALTLTPDHSGEGVYPNPTTGEVMVTCPGHEATTWVLFSVDGREVARGTFAPTHLRETVGYEFVLPASIGSGAYVLQLRDNATPLCSMRVIVE